MVVDTVDTLIPTVTCHCQSVRMSTSDKPSNSEKGNQVEDMEEAATKVEENPVFAAVKDCGNDPEKIRNHFEIDNVSVDVGDGAGMTPLMHACWKNYPRIVKFLIGQGADVNGGDHEHGYTSLHFAALSNSVDICRTLLEHGVKTDRVNSVNRTAAQMAGFVGNHECVSVINNYVPKEAVFFFTRKQPLETEPKLPLSLAKPLHGLVQTMNMHPVRVALILRDDPSMLEGVVKVCNILEEMSDREFKSKDVNETLSLKYHILHYYLKDVARQMEKDSSDGKEKKSPFIERWIKSMLVGRDEDGFPVFQENFVRQGIKEFPHQESQLFKTLVANFHHCQNYGEGASAAEYLNQAFNGQRGFKDFENCDTCGNERAEKKCSKCKSVQYCDQNCQKLHWFTHKKACDTLKAKYKPPPPPVEEAPKDG